MKILTLLVTSFFLLSFSNNLAPTKIGLPSDAKPAQIEGIGIKEKLGTKINGALSFTDQDGKVVKLSDYFAKKKPLLLSLVYYSCPNLCNLHLNGVTASLRRMDLSLGNEYEMVVVSFDHEETLEVSNPKRAAYLKEYNRDGAENGWHFLTGTKESIEELASSVGFSYRWDDKTAQWIHAASIIVLTPDGMVSKYLHGIDFNEKVIKLALVEASQGKIGTLVDRLALLCMNYVSKVGSNTQTVLNIVRIFSITLLLIIVFAIFRMVRKRGENG